MASQPPIETPQEHADGDQEEEPADGNASRERNESSSPDVPLRIVMRAAATTNQEEATDSARPDDDRSATAARKKASVRNVYNYREPEPTKLVKDQQCQRPDCKSAADKKRGAFHGREWRSPMQGLLRQNQAQEGADEPQIPGSAVRESGLRQLRG